ncbi:hypothetical protein PVL29_011519 [Vitis rotundifolia]|uniref:ABC transporter domain-containing protein n=1 Tax=Vitis rotundifolia TaxID=103349 RepID=A0AA39DQJ5_VITRO|nr:hypothetical protein PVL29_011519 [Vitis rotundifolia]
MDEISTGLDSSTTYQIVNSLRQTIHILNRTAVISLLQPPPETYDLFDDIILLSDSQIVYQGPHENVLGFFESMGFKCPQRKGVADFLQEVTSRKDQEQYWTLKNEPYRFVTAKEFAEAFQSFHAGGQLAEELATPFDKAKSHPAALTTKKYGISKKELLVACLSREHLLMKRNSFVHIFKLIQLIIMALIAMTLFLRTQMHKRSMEDGIVYFGYLFFTVIMILFNGISEIAMTIVRLPVFYKQRDLFFFPAWTYALPTIILKIPITFCEVSVWVFSAYYVVGLDPCVGRLFRRYLLLLLVNQMASALFQLIASTGRNMIVANTFGSFATLLLFALGGFVLSRERPEERGQVISSAAVRSGAVVEANQNKKKGMVLPFQPHSITFDNLRYSVDMPEEMKNQGVLEDRLELLKGVSGAFRPGVLTALMGVSGAGKTTLMDVLAGRKTGGYIEGNITISGYPKKQETFARISGYCEQNDIHSPHVTVYESLVYSAWLRLPSDVDSDTRKMFIDEVMELVELTPLKGALVGLPGVNGLSTEQCKRLTIAVEIVANPSIIFMDEPTSGLDAGAAAIVMRTVRNTVDTGRTVVCTIHQPSIDISEAFNELLLMKRRGQEIYVGPLGRHSSHLIKYFGGIEGVRKIKESYNPATWMLEVTTTAQEVFLGIDFKEIYKNSDLFRRNKDLIEELSQPAPGSKELYFPTQYSQPFFTQCMANLWKQRLSYCWHSLMFGTMFWDLGTRRKRSTDLANAMGAMFSAVIFLGIQNSASVKPVVVVERTVFYRERAAGMYSAMAYAFAQAFVEIPYIFVQTIVYGLIVYSMVGYEWMATKFLWHLFFMFFTLLYFTFYGMMDVAATPNQHVAAITGAAFYGLWNLFSGFTVPRTVSTLNPYIILSQIQITLS